MPATTSPPSMVPIALRVVESDEPDEMFRTKCNDPSAYRKLDPEVCLLAASSRFLPVGLLFVPAWTKTQVRRPLA